jgi:vacuolar-type H+-ATPase subunit H
MSDMLEKLLGAEKNAAVLLEDAETEAARRKADARAEARKKHAELLKEKTREGDAAIAAEKARIAAEKVRLIGAYKEKLAGLHRDPAAFSRAALAFVKKGET